VSMKMTAFWDIAPRSLVEVDRRFRDAQCLHHQGDGGRFSVLFPVFCLKTETGPSFQNVLILLFHNSDDGQSLEEQFYTSSSETFELQLLSYLLKFYSVGITG